MNDSKKCLNPQCNKKFTPKNPKGKYCSPNCKSAHQYQLKKEDGPGKKKKTPVLKPVIEKLKAISPTLKVASELPPTKIPAWVREVEKYCEKYGCTHDDLIEAHKNKDKKPTKKFFGSGKEKEKLGEVAGESYLEKRNRLKNR